MKKKLVLYQPLLRKWINLCVQLERRRVGGFPCLFWKQAKGTLILENIVLFVCSYGLKSNFKCIFNNILGKNKTIFPCGSLLLCVVQEVFIKVPLVLEILPWKIPGCAPVTFSFTFHPNFHPNILVFANLPIYRKLIQGGLNKKEIQLSLGNIFSILICNKLYLFV